MTELSPQAQAVLDAATFVCHPETEVVAFQCTRLEVAAALQAAAIDQNKQIDVPFSKIVQWEKIIGSTLSYWTAAQWGYQKAMSELLAIAAELKGQ